MAIGRFLSRLFPKAREKEAVRTLAGQQADAAAQQQATGQRYLGYADEDRARQIELSDAIRPAAERLVSGADLAGIERPDVSDQIRRNYADERAAIEEESGRAMGDLADYNVGSGAARTGTAGTGGLGAVFRGRTLATSANRRGMQRALSDESLAGYEDRLRRAKMAREGVALGTEVLSDQQRVFDPIRSAAVGTGSTAQAVGSRNAAIEGQVTTRQLPSRWSWLGGAIGAGLNAAATAFAPPRGLRRAF